jgi:hypothetical protein
MNRFAPYDGDISEERTPLLAVDLDGTVRHGKDELGRFVNGPDDVVVFPEAAEMMRRWKERGGKIIGVSNQGGIALGFMTMRQCADAMLRTARLAGFPFQWAKDWRAEASRCNPGAKMGETRDQ